jgi:hypothetical protein
VTGSTLDPPHEFRLADWTLCASPFRLLIHSKPYNYELFLNNLKHFPTSKGLRPVSPLPPAQFLPQVPQDRPTSLCGPSYLHRASRTNTQLRCSSRATKSGALDALPIPWDRITHSSVILVIWQSSLPARRAPYRYRSGARSKRKN